MAKQLKRGSRALSRRFKASDYDRILIGVVELLEAARRASARAVNSVMTATYWEIGRRIVEHEQAGRNRADYGKRLLERLSETLVARFGRGFGVVQLSLMRQFFLTFPKVKNLQSAIEDSGSGETEAEKDSILQSANEKFGLESAGAEMLEPAGKRNCPHQADS